MSDRQRPRIGEILVQAGVIDAHQLKAALGEQARWGRPLGQTLIKLGFLDEAELVRALAGQLGMPVATLEGKRIPPEVLALVPRDVATREMVIPLFVKRNGGRSALYLGVEDPSRLEVFDDLAFRTGMEIKLVMVSPSELCEAVDRCYTRAEEAVAPQRAASVVTPGTEELARHWSQAVDESPASKEPEPEAPMQDAPAAPLLAPQQPEAHTAEQPLVAEVAEVAARPAPDTPLVLRAIIELLVEKGVVTRDEIHGKLRDLQLAAASQG